VDLGTPVQVEFTGGPLDGCRVWFSYRHLTEGVLEFAEGEESEDVAHRYVLRGEPLEVGEAAFVIAVYEYH
jgi:hypothetical protein